MAHDPSIPPPSRRRRSPLYVRMAIGLVVGVLGGLAARSLAGGTPALDGFIEYVAQPVGKLFLRLLFMLILPLVFSALALGVAGLGDLRRVGRIGAKTLAYTVVVSAIAVLIGITLVNLLQPGAGLSEEAREQIQRDAGVRASVLAPAPAADRGTPGEPAPRAAKQAVDLLLAIVPANPVKAAADNDILAVMFFGLAIGVGLTLTRSAATERFAQWLEGLFELSTRLIHVVIELAPFGVAALLFVLSAQLGFDVLLHLARYVGVVLLALALHQFVVYSAAVKFLGGMSPLAFFRGVREAMLMAFSTASSNATLPTALEVADRELRLPPQVSRFVLTVGATANQNGTALFEGVTVLFLAQFYGVELGLAQQAMVVLVCILGGIGTAGVPAGSLPVVAMILGFVGVPPEGIGLILGVDRFLDMCRTTLNVTGDLAAAVVVARGES